MSVVMIYYLLMGFSGEIYEYTQYYKCYRFRRLPFFFRAFRNNELLIILFVIYRFDRVLKKKEGNMEFQLSLPWLKNEYALYSNENWRLGGDTLVIG